MRLLLFVVCLPACARRVEVLDRAAANRAIERGVEFLLSQQQPDGRIGGPAGLTALALWAVGNAPARPDPARLAPTVELLAGLAKPDGSIAEDDHAAYSTALALLAFSKLGVKADLIAPAQRWLAGRQFSGDTGTAAADPAFGGIGYGGKQAPDLSNLQWALEALHDSHFEERPEVYRRAQRFIERCQNRATSNDQTWAGDDGGFVYKPGASKAGGTRSSGSMTYAGFKSFLFADVGREDPRVRAAFDWLRANWSVVENPGLGDQGLYYYWHMMSRALAMWGEREIETPDGAKHDWFTELATEVMRRQRADGSWRNSDSTYWESNPVIATSHAVLALAFGVAP